MAKKILISPVIYLPEGKEGGKGRSLGSLFNAYFLQLPHGFLGKSILRGLFYLFAKENGVEREEWEKAQGVWGLEGSEKEILWRLMNGAPGEYIRVLLLLSSKEQVKRKVKKLSQRDLFGEGLPVEHGPIYVMEKAAYPYAKALLIAADVYYEHYANMEKALSSADAAELILQKVEKELKKVPEPIKKVLKVA